MNGTSNLAATSPQSASARSMPLLPFAYYDRDADCIRVQLADGEGTERSLNPFLSILRRESTPLREPIGFCIIDVRALFERLAMPFSGNHRLSDLFDLLLDLYPDAAVERVRLYFRKTLHESGLQVALG